MFCREQERSELYRFANGYLHATTTWNPAFSCEHSSLINRNDKRPTCIFKMRENVAF